MKAVVIFVIVCSVAAEPPRCAGQPKQPICATNGRITKCFRNNCAFENARNSNAAWRRTFPAACANAKRGPKHPNCDNDCDFSCLAIYDPVCGYDGRTFTTYGNKCEFRRAVCKANGGLILVDKENCNL